MKKKNILILSGIASAINYIKSLGEADDVQLFVADADPFCPGLYVHGVLPFVVPRTCNYPAYQDSINKIILQYGIDFLIPTSDYDVEAVVHMLEKGWSPPVLMYKPPANSHRILRHKGRLASYLMSFFPNNLPKTYFRVEIEDEYSWPLVIKPAAEAGGKGVYIANTKEQLLSAIKLLENSLIGDYLVQEFIPGETWILSMVYDQNGSLITAQPMRSHQTFFTWGGGGMAGEIVDNSELVVISDAIIQLAGGWRGPINLEWRRHAKTGLFILLEANCRLNGYSYLTTMNGLNLPRIALAILANEPMPNLHAVAPDDRVNFVIGYREILVDNWVVSENIK